MQRLIKDVKSKSGSDYMHTIQLKLNINIVPIPNAKRLNI